MVVRRRNLCLSPQYTGTMGVLVRVAITATPPLASTSPSLSTRVPSGNTSSRFPSFRERMAVFIAPRSLPPRLTGKMPSLRSRKPMTGIWNNSSFAITTRRESTGRDTAMRKGSHPLTWLAHRRAPPSGRFSSPTARWGKNRRIRGAMML